MAFLVGNKKIKWGIESFREVANVFLDFLGKAGTG